MESRDLAILARRPELLQNVAFSWLCSRNWAKRSYSAGNGLLGNSWSAFDAGAANAVTAPDVSLEG